MKEEFSRTAQLLGEEGVARLTGAAVAVFGVRAFGRKSVQYCCCKTDKAGRNISSCSSRIRRKR